MCVCVSLTFLYCSSSTIILLPARHWEGVPDSRHQFEHWTNLADAVAEGFRRLRQERSSTAVSKLSVWPAGLLGLIHRLHTLEHAQRCCSRPWEGVPVVTDSQSKFLTDAGTPFHFSRPDMSGLTGAISSPSLLVTLVGDSGLPFHSSGLHWLPTQRPRE